MTEADVVAFAAQTGDRHPLHTDATWASESVFGERIAHGLLVLSCAVGLLEFDPERVVALRRVADAVFKRPVRLGDTLHVEGRIAGLAPASEAAGLVAMHWTVVNQDERVVCRARVEVLWRVTQPASPAGTGDGAPVSASEAEIANGFVPIPL